MRSLVNRYMAWVSDYTDDAGFLIRMGATVAIVSGVIILVVGGLVWLANSNEPDHGSCEVGHYGMAGKTPVFICDKYYPPPRVD